MLCYRTAFIFLLDELNANLASQAAKENKTASTGGGKVGDTQASRDSGISSASAENSVANAPSGSEKTPFGPGRVRKKRKISEILFIDIKLV